MEVLKELIILNNIKTDFSIRFTYLINEIDSWSSNKRPVFFIAPLIKGRNSSDAYKTMALTKTRRISSSAMDPKVKCGANYINGRYALLEARSKGAELPLIKIKMALFLRAQEHVFFSKKGEFLTPSLDCDILESITRDTVIKILLENKFKTKEKLISEEELNESDEIFLCGSAAEITPIKLMNETDFKIGNLTKFIFKEYQLAVTDKSYKDFSWTTKLDV